MRTTRRLWIRWATLLALTAILAACSPSVTPEPAAEPDAAPATPAPTETDERQATCEDSAIRLPDVGAGIHGAIVADTLYMGGATAPATCTDPTAQSLLGGLSMPGGRTEQVQQSQYHLIVIRYPSGNRLYVLSRRDAGKSCVVDTNDECMVQVTDLPDDFNVEELPDDVGPTIPAGRPAPATVSPPSGGGDTPPGAPSPPPAVTGTHGAASDPQPRDGATGVKGWSFSRETVGGPLLSWAAAPDDRRYLVYLGSQEDLAANNVRGSPFETWDNFLQLSASADLSHGTRYYWRVDTDKYHNESVRGNVWSFTTGKAPPAATGVGTLPDLPANPQPRDGAGGVTRSGIRLSWAAAPRALSYDVYWGVSTVTELRLTDGGSGYTSAPEVWFQSIHKVSQATATATVAGGAVTALTLTHGGAGYLHAPYVTFEGGGGSGAAATAILGADLSTPINTSSTAVRIATSADLPHDTTYFWRVDAKNEAGVTRGNVWSFTTVAAPYHRRSVSRAFTVENLTGAELGVANLGLSWTAGGVTYTIGKVVLESERLEIAVTPSPSVTNIGRYHVYVSGRGPLFAFAETLDENPDVPTGRLTPGDASNPDVYEWSGFPDPITGVARASSKTLTLYEPVNWDD